MKRGAGSRGSMNKPGQDLKRARRFGDATKGCRAAGGGAKDSFGTYKVVLKTWLDVELENGVVVEPEDMIQHFEWLLDEDIALMKSQVTLEKPQQLRLRG